MTHGLVGDLRLAVRSLRATPAVTIAAVLTFTLGIGATTAMFSVANALVLRPLPVSHPERLVTITSDTALRFGFQAGAGWNYPMWDAFQQRAGGFDGAFAWVLQRLDLSDGGEMQPATVLVASSGFFSTLGVSAARGRTFTAADDARGGGPDGAVAVISDALWRRRFQARADIVGSRLKVDGVPVTIVGVAPAWFRGVDVGQPFDVALPFGTEPLVRGRRSLISNPGALLLTVMVRLKPGQTVAQATAAMRAMQPEIVGAQAPPFLREPFIVVGASTGISDRSRLRQQYLYPLVVLSIVSAAVLLIVCLNIANLLLSRASARRSEVSVRLALGVTRWRLARQYLVEALTLGVVGTAAGLLIAVWGSRLMLARLTFQSGQISLDLSLDWRVFAFTVGLAGIAVVLFGTVPALYAVRVPPMAAMRDIGRGGSKRAGAMSNGLVVAQIAVSIVLLSATGLFVRTLNRLNDLPLGFQPKGVLVASVTMPSSLQDPNAVSQLRQRMLDAVAAVPGVAHVAGSTWAPVGTGGGGLLTDARGRRAEGMRQAAFNLVTPGWFAVYGTPLHAGRDFADSDREGAPRAAIVNDAFRRAAADGAPLGSVTQASPCGRDGCTIVGVVADTVYGSSLRDPPPPIVFMPMGQSRGVGPPNAPFRISIRAAQDADGVTRSVSAALRGVDPALTFTFRRLEEDVDALAGRERLVATLATFFGAIALLLSGIGLYGVSAYAATRRRAEIGIRLALGGQPQAVLRAMLARIALFVTIGTVLGVLAALWLSRFASPLLYGLEPRDPVTLFVAATTLAIVAAVAAWIPSARAVRIDPAQVLREL
jgi:predicted permease